MFHITFNVASHGTRQECGLKKHSDSINEAAAFQSVRLMVTKLFEIEFGIHFNLPMPSSNHQEDVGMTGSF